ncbi:MAG: asparaginase [Promicromonosporaceae bacterium]|nr:asparaginase [Promicromonosporaceae bacterium]
MTELLISGAGVLAEVWRGNLLESAHLGQLVVLDDRGETTLAVGDPDAVIYARSSLKPLQTVAMLRAGWHPTSDASVALACASHSGESEHLATVRAMLREAGLDENALQNTPAYPLNGDAERRWRANGNGPSSLTQNCSGKHAAMLATCVANGWDTATYRDPAHPLQQVISAAIADLTGDQQSPHVTIDGCGAPLFSTTLHGLARAFARIATAPDAAEVRVSRAMSAHADLVGGTGRDVTAAMRAIPRLICKDGAEGVYAGAFLDGTAFAFKVLDGGARPRPAILAATLQAAGALNVDGVDAAALAALGAVPVLGGGQPVGEVRVAFRDNCRP